MVKSIATAMAGCVDYDDGSATATGNGYGNKSGDVDDVEMVIETNHCCLKLLIKWTFLNYQYDQHQFKINCIFAAEKII